MTVVRVAVMIILTAMSKAFRRSLQPLMLEGRPRLVIYVYIYIYIYIHTHSYVYIYIYIRVRSSGFRNAASFTDPRSGTVLSVSSAQSGEDGLAEKPPGFREPRD